MFRKAPQTLIGIIDYKINLEAESKEQIKILYLNILYTVVFIQFICTYVYCDKHMQIVSECPVRMYTLGIVLVYTTKNIIDIILLLLLNL